MLRNCELNSASINFAEFNPSNVMFKYTPKDIVYYFTVLIAETEIDDMVEIGKKRIEQMLSKLGYFVPLLDYYNPQKDQAISIQNVSIDTAIDMRTVDIEITIELTTAGVNLPIKYCESTNREEIRNEAILAMKELLNSYYEG